MGCEHSMKGPLACTSIPSSGLAWLLWYSSQHLPGGGVGVAGECQQETDSLRRLECPPEACMVVVT